MVTLYYAPGACSLASHIVLQELGLPHRLVKVDLKTLQYEGGDFRVINPKGYVPALKLDNGEVLTESAVILHYLGESNPIYGLVPKPASFERFRLNEWTNFVSTELHKSYSLLFNADGLIDAPQAREEYKNRIRAGLVKKLSFVSSHLETRKFLMGLPFMVADAYLFTVLRWSRFQGIDLSQWPVLTRYQDEVTERPAVQAALAAEGLRR